MRGWAADWADAWDGLRAQPARSGLSLLAIAIGIAALGVLLGVLTGLGERGRQMVRELGVNTFAVTQGRRPAAPGADWRDLTLRQAEVLAANLPDCRVAGVRTTLVPAARTGLPMAMVETGPELARVRNWTVRAGRWLDAEDVRRRARVAVVSRALAEREGLQVGGIGMIGRVPFLVVGMVDVEMRWLDGEEVGSSVDFGEAAAMVPIGHVGSGGPGREGKLDAVFVHVPDGGDYAERVEDCRRLLAHPDLRASGLSWVTPDVLLSRIRSLQQMIRFTAGSLSGLCLLLGGTTLMSLMVANVRERIREIGLRRALGARRQDIARLFMLEAAALTASAGVAGVLIANALLVGAGVSFPLPTKVGVESAVLPLAAALLLGLAFSYGPARLAARISPSEALRDE